MNSNEKNKTGETQSSVSWNLSAGDDYISWKVSNY